VSRPTLTELRETVLDELNGEWRSPSDLGRTLGLGNGVGWYQLCLTLERLANDGLAELQTPGWTVRRFRRSRDR
jgi:hypothetical protein